MSKLFSDIEIRQERRLCKVDGELGYFHRWEEWMDVMNASLIQGGHPGGQISRVYGIVEFKDRVREVIPSKIRFCDEENEILCEMAKHWEEGRISNEKGEES